MADLKDGVRSNVDGLGHVLNVDGIILKTFEDSRLPRIIPVLGVDFLISLTLDVYDIVLETQGR